MKLESNFKCYYNCSKLPQITDDAKKLANTIANENNLTVGYFKNMTDNENNKKYTRLLLKGYREYFKYLYLDSNWKSFYNKYHAVLDQTIPYGKLKDF